MVQSNHACSSRHPRAKAATLGTASRRFVGFFSDVLLVAECRWWNFHVLKSFDDCVPFVCGADMSQHLKESSKQNLPCVFPILLDFLTLVCGHRVFFGTLSITTKTCMLSTTLPCLWKLFAGVLQVLPGSSVMQETQLSSMKTNFMQQARHCKCVGT